MAIKAWRYDFDCHHCEKVKYIKDEHRDGNYCTASLEGKKTIHADDDRVLRCNEYVSSRYTQLSLF